MRLFLRPRFTEVMLITLKICKSGLHQYSGRRCAECGKSRMAEYRTKNKEAIRAQDAEYRDSRIRLPMSDTERIAARAAGAKYRALNPDKVREEKRAYRAANADAERDRRRDRYIRCIDHENAISAAWRKANPAKVNAQGAARRAVQLKATPVWANRAKIEEFYYTAAMLGMHTGEFCHVDHIVPLRGKIVCGLHWEGNLQILTAKQNIEKGNRF